MKKAIAFLSKSELDLAVVEAVRISHPLEELVAVHDGNEALGEIELVACDEGIGPKRQGDFVKEVVLWVVPRGGKHQVDFPPRSLRTR